MVSRIRLSQELLDEIAGHLHDEVTSLRTLSVVSSNFSPVCSELLFYSLRLHSQNFARWHDRVQERPVLTRLFRAVELCISNHLPVDEQRFIFILDKISRPNHIKIKNYHGENMRTELQNALAKLIDKPTVRSLEMFNLKEIPFSFFSGITHFRTIKFSNSNFAIPKAALRPNLERESTRSQTLGTPIRDLSIFGHQRHYDLVDHPQFPLDLRNLRRLKVNLLHSNVNQVQHLLSGCGQSLRDLSIRLQGGSASLQHLVALRVLQLTLWIVPYSTKEATIRSMSGFADILRSLQNADSAQSRPQLEEIIIAATIFPVSMVHFPPKFWTDLDSALGNIQVGRMRIVMTCSSENRALMPDWTLLLPTFHRSGRLVSSFSDIGRLQISVEIPGCLAQPRSTKCKDHIGHPHDPIECLRVYSTFYESFSLAITLSYFHNILISWRIFFRLTQKSTQLKTSTILSTTFEYFE
ncbi:hypothetical protein BDN72DRAFT_901355 [Pluteus cervinus]|uniref:Uncharacterized protein n=1 Tax=Pluteus cervinus TaxID=181527 RepID=A0ACD3AGL7_9AGAR|nr:hypothetical protein BDN72DRAFT_901355 [Pluteus cervinus]